MTASFYQTRCSSPDPTQMSASSICSTPRPARANTGVPPPRTPSVSRAGPRARTMTKMRALRPGSSSTTPSPLAGLRSSEQKLGVGPSRCPDLGRASLPLLLREGEGPPMRRAVAWGAPSPAGGARRRRTGSATSSARSAMVGPRAPTLVLGHQPSPGRLSPRRPHRRQPSPRGLGPHSRLGRGHLATSSRPLLPRRSAATPSRGQAAFPSPLALALLG